MTMPAVQPLPSARVRAWLVTNWPAAAWLLAAAVVSAVQVRMIPEAYRQTTALAAIPEHDRADMRRALAALNLSPTDIGRFEIFTFNVVSTIVGLIVGWLLIRRSPRTGFACFLAFVLLAFTNAVYPPSIAELLPGQPVAQTIIRLTTVVGIGGFFTLPFIFPDGRFVPRWTVIWGIYNFIGVFVFAFAPSLLPEGPPWGTVEAVTTVSTVVSIVYAVVYRYRKVSTLEQRRQTRWVMFGLMLGVPGFFLGDAMMRNISASPAGVACLLGFLIVMPIVTTLPTVTLGIAILHHRLFDIDVVLNRTLAWLVMTIAVTGTYIGVVLGVGSLIGSRSNLVLSLLATGIVAVGFQPLHLRVQRVTSRLLFGDRDDPYTALARLGHQIEDSLSASDLLPQIVRTTAEALRLPYAALFLEHADGPTLVASSGVATQSIVRLPLIYQGQTVGALDVATRAPGETFSLADRRLLEDLARQVGVAARTVSLATELQQSREQIVTSREEERRRLRRDLHDGLGSQLAALTMQAGAARTLIRTNPDGAEQELVALRDELRWAVVEVRRLVLGLRPPALDELGLIGALQARLARLDRGGGDAEIPLRVLLDAEEPFPPLSAAMEVAAFRIVEEAVTNVVKHAHASSVTASLHLHADTLLITVVDDGVGLASQVDGTGMGLQSMRERAGELGGSCVVNVGPDGRGTMVQATLPRDRGTEKT